jgi:hypothetical protein
MATMTAVWVLVRARLRARWRALLGLALLVGVASGAVMAAAVGARRTDPAYSRLLEPTRAEDVELEIGGFDNSGFIDSLARLPQVADMGLESVALVTPNMPGDPPKFSTSSPRLQDVMSVDGRVGWTVNRPLILAGRRPDPARPDEVGLSESLARRWRVGPGDTIRLRALSPEQLEHGLPGVLAGLLALLGASTFTHLLLTAIRRRGHDLAILKTLGFVRRQVSATVARQATTVAMVAVVIGVPLGVALGRWTWSLLIDRIGLSAEPVTPGPSLLATVLGAMLVANLVAVWPGQVAARTRLAVALRSE